MVLDVANFARNYIGGNLDRSGFGQRMTKWDGIPCQPQKVKMLKEML
jgi:hypothetical protein